MNEDYVLMGKHLTDPKLEWMIYRGTEVGAEKTQTRMKTEDIKDNLEYEIKHFTQYLEDKK